MQRIWNLRRTKVGLRVSRFMLICNSLHSSGERAGIEVAVALKFLEELNDNWRRRRRKKRRRRRRRRRRRKFT
jgi:hypothetical protein